MPIWHQSPKLTPRYFLETPRLFGYPFVKDKKTQVADLGLFNVSEGKVFACLFIITIAKTCIELFFCIIFT